jgi:hypothetical protein
VLEAADFGLTDAAPVHVRFAAPARRFCCCAQSDPRVSRLCSAAASSPFAEMDPAPGRPASQHA